MKIISTREALFHSSFFMILIMGASCAPRFILRPTGDQIIERDSKDYSFSENVDCRLEAAFLDEKLESSFIEFQITSKSKKTISISHEQVRLEGPSLPSQKVSAADPGLHRKKLEEEILLIDKRLSASTWDGVGAIHDYLVTEKSDETIEKSKDEYANNKKERERLEKRSALLKRELAFLGEKTFRQTSLEPKTVFTGIALFPTPYLKEGDANLLIDTPACRIQVPFAVRIGKSSLFK